MSNMTKMEQECFAQASFEPEEIVAWAHSVLHSDLSKQDARQLLKQHEQEILAAMYGAGWGTIETALRREQK